MKYQQLETLESGWKWKYLLRKHQEGALITKYIEESQAKHYVDELISLENQPKRILEWIENHLNPEWDNRLKQTIRAKRKRYFNAAQQHLRKKSIDLNFLVWQRLALLAKNRGLTLSETIVQLIDDAESKDEYANKISLLKENLQDMLSTDIDNM